LEQQVFQVKYPENTLADRLTRLEEAILGTSQAGTEDQRYTHLRQIVPQNTSQPSLTNPLPQIESPVIAAGSPSSQSSDVTDYPQVTQMEQAIWGRTFEQQPLAQRLGRLEEKVFQQSYLTDSLVDRTDRLFAAVPTFQSFSSYDPAWVQQQNRKLEKRSMFGLDENLTQLETRTFNQTFPYLLITERLTQLENHILGQSFNGESVDTRLLRLQNEVKRQAQAKNNPSINTQSQWSIENNSTWSSNQWPFAQQTVTRKQQSRGFVVGAPGTVIIQDTEVVPVPYPVMTQPINQPQPYISF